MISFTFYGNPIYKNSVSVADRQEQIKMKFKPSHRLHTGSLILKKIKHTKIRHFSIPYPRILGLSFLLVLFFAIILYSIQRKNTTDIQVGIASQIIRFHVIANSDSDADQALKLKVKDALTESLRSSLEHAANIKEARTILKKNLGNMETLSDEIIEENGFTYTAKASLEQGYFPLKVYGDLSLPPGEYEAVRVELGSAKGHNWWCIMYPPLCFVDSTYGIVPDSSKAQLKYLLTDQEYRSLFTQKKVKVKVKFKLLPWLNKFTK